ncbi:IclR family transcriptional regulator [Solicola gregarius]|uniref:Glycerol operon regulatory protein n=1 Tax=Solicola gregarius TaxID=2908642 RepID=A0AA46TEK7_9ACTN|nr:IclR family transcriptional regulator [Solicola gregarius]UYM03924.1 IclR family transcriptional regulator [Solicola gregarius]
MSNNNAGAPSRPSAVQSVDRAISVLEVLAHAGQAGVTEIAAELGVHKSTAFRLVSALEARELVEQDSDRGKYRLGLGILRLAGATTARLDVVQEARPKARTLAIETGETVNIAVLSEGAALYLDQVAGSSSVQSSHNWVGQRIPLHATSNGKTLLSGLTDDQIRRETGRKLAAYTPKTVTDHTTLLAEVAEVRADGYSVVSDELEIGLTAVAAPLRNAHGDVVASLSVSGPTFRFDADKVDAARKHVVAAAEEISARLGWRLSPGSA